MPYARFLKNVDPVSSVPPCTDSAGTDLYLRDPDVLKAYHISPNAFEWVMCTDAPNLVYTCDYVRGSLYAYPFLIDAGLKILIYSGDVDGSVPTIGTREWIAKLDLPVVQGYTPWTIEQG